MARLFSLSFILVTGLTTSCGSTWFFRQFRSVFRPGLLFGRLASLPVGLILDALLFGMQDFGLFMAAFPDEVALFGYQSYHYLW